MKSDFPVSSFFVKKRTAEGRAIGIGDVSTVPRGRRGSARRLFSASGYSSVDEKPCTAASGDTVNDALHARDARTNYTYLRVKRLMIFHPTDTGYGGIKVIESLYNTAGAAIELCRA